MIKTILQIHTDRIYYSLNVLEKLAHLKGEKVVSLVHNTQKGELQMAHRHKSTKHEIYLENVEYYFDLGSEA